MRVKLGLTLLGLLSACSLAAVGCGGDDDDDDSGGRGGTGGSAGSAGKGAAAGKGGTAGSSTAGKGNTGGSSGSGGSGGTGASSGESGAGGQAGGGEGGSVGGAGGAAGESGAGGTGAAAGEGGGGGAHEAGAGGAGGETPVETATFCSYGCETTEDCSTSTAIEYECHSTRRRCEDPTTSCDVSSDCVAFTSFWFAACTSSEDCHAGEECVAVGGRGYCAYLPDGGICSFPETTVFVPRFVDGTSVEVCGSDAGYCDPNHTCQMGCATNEDCTTQLGVGSVCNTTTHQCGCTASTECTGPGVSVCNPATQRCECAVDDDCAAVANRPRCVEGVCGCSDAATDCSASPFAGAAEATCR